MNEALRRRLAEAAQAVYDRTEGDGIQGASLCPGVGAGVLLSDVEAAHDAKRSGRDYVWLSRRLDAGSVRATADAVGVAVAWEGDDARSAPVVFAALGTPAVSLSPEQVAELESGEWVTVDGTRGVLAKGARARVPGRVLDSLPDDVAKIKAAVPLRVVAEASTVPAVARAATLAADVVRIDADSLLVCSPALETLQGYLLSSEASVRHRRLDELTALVRRGCVGLLEAAGDVRATVALAGRPPESYFPSDPQAVAAVADQCGLRLGTVRAKLEELRAGNSRLGLRGVRWVLADPQLFSAIARGVFEACADVADAAGREGRIGLLLPAVNSRGALSAAKVALERVRAEVSDEFECPLYAYYGAGIEAARGALNLDEIAAEADFVEYDAHGLTETLFGLSPDDADRFLPRMIECGIYASDPFAEVDPVLGQAVALAQSLSSVAARRVPATLRGPQALRPSGVGLLDDAGLHGVTVPAAESLKVRLLLGRHWNANPARDPSRILTEALISAPLEGADDSPIPDALPAGIPPLQVLEELVRDVAAGKLTARDALLRVPPTVVDSVSRPLLDTSEATPISTGIGASPGCGVGRVALSAEKAEAWLEEGEPYVLVIHEVYGEEAAAVRGAEGLVSVRGGSTSHAAMVAANSGVPCVIDEGVYIDIANRRATIGEQTLAEGDLLSVDGTTGAVYAGAVPLIDGSGSEAFATLMGWADAARRITIKANADTADEVAAALEAGAAGIGLVRTEHMFFGEERLEALRAVILQDPEQATQELARLEELQRDDFLAMLRAAGSASITFRLLDAPMYEFLPQTRAGVEEIAAHLGIPLEEAGRRVDAQQPFDSLMAMRGLRLSVVRPEIERTQVRALAGAHAELRAEGVALAPLRIMLPMVSGGEEMAAAAERVQVVVREVAAERSAEVPLELSSMMEVPRAVFDAGAITSQAKAFAWGTNDLTQFALGLGRNVAGKIVPSLVAAGALQGDPTQTLDAPGAGKLVRIGEAAGRHAAPKLETGVCGRHGAEPRSIRLFHRLGLDYVSVPPAQVAKAKLAAAQAAILDG